MTLLYENRAHSDLAKSGDIAQHRADIYVQDGAFASSLNSLVDNVANGDYVRLVGFTTYGDGGEGQWRYDSTKARSEANLGTILDTSVALNLTAQGTGTGTGCWVREYTEAVNVKWFGAKGDGVTDDTDAISTAISESEDLYIPKGDYVIKSPLSIGNHHTVMGAGVEVTTLLTEAAITLTGQFITGRGAFQQFGGFTIQGKADRSHTGIYITTNAYWNLHNIVVSDCSIGIDIFGGLIGSFDDCAMRNSDIGIQAVQDDDGVDIDAYTNLIQFNNCQIIQNKQAAVFGSATKNSGKQIVFNHCQIESNGIDINDLDVLDSAIVFNHPNAHNVGPDITFRNCWFEDNAGDIFIEFIAADAINTGALIVDGCTFLDIAKYGVVYTAGATTIGQLIIKDSFFPDNLGGVGGKSVVQTGVLISGSFQNSYIRSFDIESSEILHYQRDNTLLTSTLKLEDSGIDLVALSGSLHSLINIISNNLSIASGKNMLLDTASATNYVGISQNLLLMNSRYLWMDASNQLRIDSSLPADKNTDGIAVAMATGTTGGAGSAGSGNQYVQVKIDGVTYKLLHDGTV